MGSYSIQRDRLSIFAPESSYVDASACENLA